MTFFSKSRIPALARSAVMGSWLSLVAASPLHAQSWFEQFDRFEPLPAHLYSPGVLESEPSDTFNFNHPLDPPYGDHYTRYGIFLRPQMPSSTPAENQYTSDIEARMETEGLANLGGQMVFEGADGTDLPYYLLVPEGYDADDTTTRYPLLIVIHGQGGVGGSTPTWETKFMSLDEHRARFPAFVLNPNFPARPTNYPDENDPNNEITTSEYFDAFTELIDTLILQEQIDPQRVYSTGFSMGGAVTWTLLYERPDLLAAAAPFAGGSGGNDATRTLARAAQFKDTAIWAGIGTHDFIGANWGSLGALNYRYSYETVRAAGHGAIRYWEITELDHSASLHYRRFLTTVEWMFSLSRGDPVAPGFMHVPHDTELESGQPLRYEGWAYGRPEATYYEWRRDGAIIPGADGPLLEIAQPSPADSGSYTVTAFFPDGGSITSPAASLTVHPPRPPEIISSPASLGRLEFESAVFQVETGGSMPQSFTWSHNGAPLSDGPHVTGSDSPVLTLTDLRVADSGTYAVQVTNSEGTTTASAVLTVDYVPPSITAQPVAVITASGNTVSLAVEAAGSSPFEYQWFRDGEPLIDDARTSGSTTAALAIIDALPGDSGDYHVQITNPHSSILSDSVPVEVIGSGDEVPLVYLSLDFGDAVDPPPGDWTTLNAMGTHSGFTHFVTGEPMPALTLAILNTGGSGLQASGATDAWGARSVAPAWAHPFALADRMWVNEGHSASIVISGLEPGAGYSMEIASSFAGSGTAGNRPGQFVLQDVGGPVDALNPHSGDPLGSTVLWTSRGPDDGGDSFSAEGWILWPEAIADASGELTLLLSAPPSGGGNPRVSLNTMRLLSFATQSPVSGYQAWIDGWPAIDSEERGPDDNPSGDGLTNLMKYALDLDPTIGVSGIARRLLHTGSDSGESFLVARIPESTRRDDLLYQVEYSNDLNGWHLLAEAVGSAAFTLSTDAPATDIEQSADSIRVTLESPPPDPRFFRIQIVPID